MITVKNPINDVYERLQKAVEPKVGKNFSMNMSDTPAKFPYIRLMYLGGTTTDKDLEGNESGINISFQVESYQNGQKALSKVWELDSIAHQAMVDMGFGRTYNNLVENADSNIKRVVSRYTMLYTGYLLGEKLEPEEKGKNE